DALRKLADPSQSGRADSRHALENKLNQLSTVLNQSTEQLKLANLKLKAYEAKYKSDSDSEQAAAAKQATMEKAKTEVAAPTVSSSTASNGKEQKKITFAQLPSSKGAILATNIDFGDVYGRKLVFRPATGAPKSYDVDELHLGVLAHLNLDPDILKRDQSEIDQRLKEQEAAYRKDLAERRAAEAKVAAERAKLEVEYARLREEQRRAKTDEDLKRKQIENDRLRAEASLRAADAAMQEALKPEYIIQPVYTTPVIIVPRGSTGTNRIPPFIPPSPAGPRTNSAGRSGPNA
ncbi:MAG TPA: hypothetical protein VK968_18715, partial [Roseimicrobium sp.]|nr:hypothetical protein [Roseimicrobium sp.]